MGPSPRSTRVYTPVVLYRIVCTALFITSATIYCDPSCLFVCLFVGWLVGWLVRSFVGVFVRSLVRIRSPTAMTDGRQKCRNIVWSGCSVVQVSMWCPGLLTWQLWATIKICTGNIGNSLGLTNKPNKWTNIADVDEPRYVNLEDDIPSDLHVTTMYHNRPVVSFSDEYANTVLYYVVFRIWCILALKSDI